MKRSELEKDAYRLLDEIKHSDYEIPTNSAVMSVVLKKLLIVIVIQFVLIGGDCIYNDVGWRGVVFISIVSLGVNALFAIIFIMSLYQPISMSLSVSEEVKRNSLIVQLLMKSVRRHWLWLVLINTAVGLVLVLCGDGFVVGLGVSWFVTFMITMIAFQMSLSRYMTPAVVGTLSLISEMISPSGKSRET
ncbi:protein traS [Enterobacter kobei]|nr:protein traS [Enterobacter kobei]